MSRYKYKKTYSLTPEISYLTGLIASDGCLLNNNRHINLTSKDVELINITQKILGTNVKVSKKISYYGSHAYHLQFSNVALYDFLLDIGLTPAKSKTIGQLLVKDDCYADFLRGYFDGDGTVYGFWDKRWPNSLMYYSEFVSASKIFLEWLQANNSRLIGVSNGRIKSSTRAFSLSYAKLDSQKLFNFMYYDQNLPLLSRKQDKFIDFLRRDPYPDKALLARVAEW
jgi:intein/homing endonuclease